MTSHFEEYEKGNHDFSAKMRARAEKPFPRKTKERYMRMKTHIQNDLEARMSFIARIWHTIRDGEKFAVMKEVEVRGMKGWEGISYTTCQDECCEVDRVYDLDMEKVVVKLRALEPAIRIEWDV